MARAILIVMDSFGVGGAPDAEAFGDIGSNTLGNIMAACARGEGDKPGLRQGPLMLLNLAALGLFDALDMASGVRPEIPMPACERGAFFGAASEISKGKDTPSGHWEIAGYPVTFDWGYFPHTIPAMPQALLEAIYADAGIEGSLGNYHASGTDILTALGEDHIKTGLPIFYTSTDSVLQIAAHEEHFGLQRLYDLCESAKIHTDALNIGRVIARPFVGSSVADFERTGNRRDFAIPPSQPTLLNRIEDSGHKVIAIGKIGDIFAHTGITEVHKAHGNAAVGVATLKAMEEAGDGDLV
ncbi:MAG: phosphopentomutase, partial [Ahrensia sp.]